MDCTNRSYCFECLADNCVGVFVMTIGATTILITVIVIALVGVAVWIWGLRYEEPTNTNTLEQEMELYQDVMAELKRREEEEK